MPTSIILDCDPGVDDALAIAFAHGHPGIDLVGITTVAGNVGLAQTTANALAVCEYVGAGGTPVVHPLDVTDPEPLPDGHPLWGRPNCIITPHTADTIEMVQPLLAERIRSNVIRFAEGDPLIGIVDPVAGY